MSEKIRLATVWLDGCSGCHMSLLDTDERLFDSFATAGGAGVRLLINKRSKTNLCFDVGFGKQGSKGVYLAIQEAF